MLKDNYDIIVVGGGPGGIPAAIAAARGGARTLLIERSAILGGLAVSGLPLLGYIDRTGKRVLGGIAQEFINELEKIDGGTIGHFRCPVHNSLTPINAAWGRIVFFDMVEKAGVDTLLYSELTGVHLDDGAICGVDILVRGEPRHYETSILIDATGDGCAAYLAGAETVKGDEKNGEMQPPSLSFNVGGVDRERLLSYIRQHPETTQLPDTYGVHQTEDQFFSSKGFAFTGFAELIEKARENGDFNLPRDRIIFTTLPSPGEFLVNSTRALGIDMTDPESVIRGEFSCHRQIRMLMNFFRKYAPGFENCFLASISPCLGGRESRRAIGLKTLTISDVAHLLIPEDTVALAGYNVDIHVPETEKLFLQPVEQAIGIPYGCLVSKNIRGLLLSGRCISVDRQAFGLTRIMGTCMAVGEAAGHAACIAINTNATPDRINIDALRDRIVSTGGILSI